VSLAALQEQAGKLPGRPPVHLGVHLAERQTALVAVLDPGVRAAAEELVLV
jgi:hypothetical protein